MADNRRKRIRRTEQGKQRDPSDKPRGNQSKKKQKQFSQIVFRDWCKKCGICSSFCPKNVIGSDEYGGPVFERPEDCIGCRFCELHCPDFAITIEELDSEKGEDE